MEEVHPAERSRLRSAVPQAAPRTGVNSHQRLGLVRLEAEPPLRVRVCARAGIAAAAHLHDDRLRRSLATGHDHSPGQEHRALRIALLPGRFAPAVRMCSSPPVRRLRSRGARSVLTGIPPAVLRCGGNVSRRRPRVRCTAAEGVEGAVGVHAALRVLCECRRGCEQERRNQKSYRRRWRELPHGDIPLDAQGRFRCGLRIAAEPRQCIPSAGRAARAPQRDARADGRYGCAFSALGAGRLSTTPSALQSFSFVFSRDTPW